jgi:hypothetical protein
MADLSRGLYRGLLIPDGDLSTIWAAESTVDEAGNRAGIPATSSKTESILEASGHQLDTGDGKSLEIRSLRGGYPGPGEAGFCWTRTGGAAQDYRGWDVPASISTWENAAFNSTANYNLHADLVNVTKEDGTDYMVSAYEFVSGSNVQIAVRKRTGDTWGAENIIYVEGGFVVNRYLYPTIMVLPSGRLILFYLVYDHVENIAQIQMAYSDDESTNWTVGGSYTLPDTIPLTTQTPKRLKVAYKDGQILLLAWVQDTTTTNADLLIQYASDDLGASFLKILEFTGADNPNTGALPDVTVSEGTFVIGWITGDGLRPSINRLGSAYQPLTPATPFIPQVVDPTADLAGGLISGELSICTDEDGVIYLFTTQEPSGQGVCITLRSYDGGENWVSMGVGGAATSTYGRWWGANEPSSGFYPIQPLDYTAEFNRGRAVVVHRYENLVDQAAPGKNSLCFFYLGGYSSVSLPGLELFKRDSKRVGFPTTWVPFSIPKDDGTWTGVTTGAGPTVEAIVAPGRLQLAVAAGDTHYYEVTPSEGSGNNQVRFQDGFIGRFSFEVAIAPSIQQFKSRIWTGSGPNYAELVVTVTDTNIFIIDGVGGAFLATLPNAVGQRRQVFWAIKGLITGQAATGAECAVWVRNWNTNEDRLWELAYQGSLVLGAGGTTSFVQWGDLTAANASDTYWDGFQLCFGKQTILPNLSFTGYQLAQGQINPEELFPRNYSDAPLFVDSNTRVAAVDGPTFEVDKWAVDVRHLQATENIFVVNSPSPQKTWRSKTAPVNAEIAFQRNPSTQDAWAANDIYAIHFENINFKRAEIQIRTAGVWVSLGVVEFYEIYEFSRSGHTIRPSGQSGGGFYAYYNEFKDLKFEFNPDTPTSMVSTVLRNSEGIAYKQTTAKPATVFLNPKTFDYTVAPSAGVAHLWFKKATVLIQGVDATTPIEGIKLKLCPTGTLPPEGYYEAGQIIPGSVAVFGWDYSRERNITNTPNVEIETLRDGTRHSYKAGEPRKRVRFSWSEGVDVTQTREVWGVGDAPDYLKTQTGGGPVALRNDAPLLMSHLLDRIDGPGLPVVYIPYIQFQSSGVLHYDVKQSDRGSIYGRTLTPVTLEQVVGSEEVDEVYRVNTVTIEQEL